MTQSIPTNPSPSAHDNPKTEQQKKHPEIKKGKTAMWKQIAQVAAVPVSTVLVTCVVWAAVPHPQIPANFRLLPQSLQAVGKLAGSAGSAASGSSGTTGTSGGATGTSATNKASSAGKAAKAGVSGANSRSSSNVRGSTGSASSAAGSTSATGASTSTGVTSATVVNLGFLGAEDGPTTGKPAPTSSEADTPGSSANSNAARVDTPKTLVSLGDSITFGFGLPGSHPGHPSKDAYPSLVGKAEGMKVTNLGVTSWSSADLQNALETTKFQDALQHANLVTIDIGSNDLLHASYNLLDPNAILPPKNAVLDNAIFQQAISNYVSRLQEIIQTVRGETTAPIILMNLYDPFPDGSSLHNVAEQLLTRANQSIWDVAAQYNLPVVDAYGAINHQQSTDIRLNDLDIHPTKKGQAKLAGLIEQAVAAPDTFIPKRYAISNPGTLVYQSARAGSNAIGWLRGDTGFLVTGELNNDWQVQLPNGQTGYVDKQKVTVLTRPWPNEVRFGQVSTPLTNGTVTEYQMPTSLGSAGGFLWNGIAYVPLKVMATAADSTVQTDDATRTIHFSTPLNSGLIQGSWALAAQGAGASSGQAGVSGGSQAQLNLVFTPDDNSTQKATLETSGWLLEIDGQPTELGAPIVKKDGILYVPADTLWTALGGYATLGTNGLLTLSATDS